MYRMAYTVPQWLYGVSPGYYTLQELSTITNASTHNIFMRFETLKVEKIKKKTGSFHTNVYHWPGAEYFVKKFSQIICKEIQKKKGKLI
jgi:hypothetical protein